MNATVGLFGVLGFFAFELSFVFNILRKGTDAERDFIRSAEYFALLAAFSIAVFSITCIFAAPDIKGNIFPLRLENLSVFSAARAVVVGMATVNLYKKPLATTDDELRIEDGSEKPRDRSLRDIHFWWRRRRFS